MPYLFEAPVGPEDQRNAGIIWPTDWRDANPYNLEKTYEVKAGRRAYHTGADLNLKKGVDNNAPVYAIGAGKVTYAQVYPTKGVWGGLIVIYHGVVEFIDKGVPVKKVVYSRYGHVQGITVKKDMTVTKGQQIARIGGTELGFDPHLHFDISTTSILDKDPGFWPGLNANLVREHFVDPMIWLYNHIKNYTATNSTPVDKENTSGADTELRYSVFDGAQVREHHSTSAKVVFELKKGAELPLLKTAKRWEGYIWGEICGGPFNGHWVAVLKEDDKTLLFDTKKPA